MKVISKVNAQPSTKERFALGGAKRDRARVAQKHEGYSVLDRGSAATCHLPCIDGGWVLAAVDSMAAECHSGDEAQ